MKPAPSSRKSDEATATASLARLGSSARPDPNTVWLQVKLANLPTSIGAPMSDVGYLAYQQRRASELAGRL